MKQRVFVVGVVLTMLLLAACDSAGEPSGSASESESASTTEEPTAAVSLASESETASPPAPGEKVRIALSAPGAERGWLAAITENAQKAAAVHDDVELVVLPGTDAADAQIAQVERVIADEPDALVILPHDAAALTAVAQQAMAAGIPVVNVDRALSSPLAYRTFIGGDNYGIGVSAGNYFAEQLGCKGKVVEIQGLAGISVTEDRSRGFRDAIEQCDGRIKIVASQPANFRPDLGLKVMEKILQRQPDIDAVYTHDDDMAEGVVAAVVNAGRQGEMFLTGAGGSAKAMDAIAAGGPFTATFLYNPSMSASAVNVARLIALGEGMQELAEPDVPGTIVLPAAPVTKDNVEEYRALGY